MSSTGGALATVRTLQVGDLEFEVVEAGVGGSPLLLVHGYTGAKEDFRDAVVPLAEAGYWVVAPDLRGHGGSHAPESEDDYSLRHFADDVHGIVEALGRVEISSPIVIRLDGTNAEEGRAILEPHLSDKLQMQPTMLAAAATAVELANR